MRRKRRTVNSDGVRLAVRDAGRQGKPVVLVHGLGYGQHSWDRVTPRLLSTSSLRVLSYDQRGHGASDSSDDYSPLAFAEDLVAARGSVSEAQLHEAFNLGCGFCCVVAPTAATRAVDLLGSFHPSQQNTFTGKLTAADLDRVLRAVRRHLGGR